nr:GcrA family cell cycle regulator [Rhodoblastus sphagnicola]
MTLEELGQGHCRWAVAEFEPRVYLFCGAQSLPTKPYCAGHASLAYETRRPRDATVASTRERESGVRRRNAYIGDLPAKVQPKVCALVG